MPPKVDKEPNSKSMDQLAAAQDQHGQDIQRIITNYRKDPQDRKTYGYYEERLRRLEAAWSLFETTDQDIRELPFPPLDHPYFAKDYYHKITAVYEEFKQHLTKRMIQLKEHENLNFPPMQIKDAGAESIERDANTAVQISHKEVIADLAAPDPSIYEDSTESTNRETAHGAIPKTYKSISYPTRTQSNDTEAIKILRRQRAVTQALLRLLNNLEGSNLTNEPKAFYEVKIKTINQYWSQIENCNNDLWETTADPTLLGYDLADYIQLEERVQQSVIQLSIKLEETQQSAATPTQISTIVTSTSTSMLKLPKITLPKFDGDYSKWRQFCDLFTQMVHNQPMANCQKMWYLKTYLVGEAEKLLRHFTLSEDNYVAAWTMLQDRYENPRLLTASLIHKLLNQPSHSTEAPSATLIKTMHDTTKECLLGLQNLGLQTTHWDPLLLHILYKKLDRTTHSLYEQGLSNPKELQTMANFLTFLETRFQSLEALGSKARRPEEGIKRQGFVKSSSTLTSVIASNHPRCVACQDTHPLFRCRTFLKMTPSNRLSFVNKHNMCPNCLKKGHNVSRCTLRGCSKCAKKHNTLVHLDSQLKPENVLDKSLPKEEASANVTSHGKKTEEAPLSLAARFEKESQGTVILGTALVNLINENGEELVCRAILDSGSQVNLITEKIVKKLGVATSPTALGIKGIGDGLQQTKRRVNIQLGSRINGFSTRLEAFVLDHIIAPQPNQLLEVSNWAIPNNIQLADPTFNRPDRIDLLIGAEFFFPLMSIGQINLGQNLPTLQNTILGWIVSGRTDQPNTRIATCGICSEEEDIDKSVERFWKIEEVDSSRAKLSSQEMKCESFFNQTIRRNEEGRFIVKLPFQDKPDKLGESSDIAIRRLVSIERRLAKDPEVQSQYVEFMREYVQLNHMSEVDYNKVTKPNYFLPHHCILKPTSTTTKLRVVFDASTKTSSNIALNDLLAAGPTIQDDLFTILLRFRLPRYVFTADIEKMYRQILVAEEDRKYQLVLWREKSSEPIRCYQLNTVTYGTTSAPYLATKCLQRLATQGAEQFPLGASTLMRDFYMDDLMTGRDQMHEALEAQAQLNTLLQTAGFKLRKWCSNHKELLKNVPSEDRSVQLDIFDNSEEQVSTLGLSWTPQLDEFRVKASWSENDRVTKRTVLSDIAHLFDPLGFMSPVVVMAKIFLQQLWQLKIDWDAALPLELHSQWITFRQNLKALRDIRIPRHMFKGKLPKSIQLHAFADASEKAYGAAIYLRSINKDGTIIVNLLCAKSKVAPLKTVTLPRLELCAAKLAAELVHRVVKDLQIRELKTFYWTDSEIVLAWINSEAASYHTFVANRIAAIQELSTREQWRHVASKHNPADIVSRGLLPDKLATNAFWFYGPLFLHGAEDKYPVPYKRTHTSVEQKEIRTILTTASSTPHLMYMIDHQNKFERWQRIIAYVWRFISNTRTIKANRCIKPSPTPTELDEALMIMIKQIQREEFQPELRELEHSAHISPSSSLSSLSPFRDGKGVLRVGGRLEASNLPYDAKHPILLPYAHEVTRLLMTDLHIKHLHVAPQALLAITRQRFWPIKGKTIARSVVQKCVRCARAKPKMLSQLMGNLPEHRVQPARPFINAGVDFFGPCWTHYKLRGKRPQKSYVAVFCCFATKATHFEVVTDLTTEAFLGALKRFIGRRGNCRHLYCDNATNFAGAKNKLEELNQTIYADKSQEKILNFCSSKAIEFHFIPPRAPHFGGLWEAAVKSAKHLLQPSLETAALTYEELETLMVEIEAILNSRPLTPLSSNPDDFSALTPGHFLIGEPTTTLTDPQSRELKISLLQRWKLVSQLKNQFWQRWAKEYLSELQHRYKWKQQCNKAEPGMMVVVKEDNLPVSAWHLGRILKVIKGDDGLARVADIRTSRGILRRPIHKLAPLPIEPETVREEEPTLSKARETDSASTSSNKRVHQGESASSTTIKKPFRGNTGAAILITLLTCLVMPIMGQIDIKPFDSPPGLYFETMGNTHLVSNEWNLVIYYNTSTLWNELSTLKQGVEKLQNACNLMKDWDPCGPIMAQFTSVVQEITNNNELLLQHTKTRSKRGALNIVGNVANALFGVLDAEYANQMSNIIKNLKESDTHILELMKNHTSILDSTVNLVQRSQENTEFRLQQFDRYLNQSISQIHTMSTELHRQQSLQSFMALALQLILILSNFQRIQSSLLDVVIDTHHGKINPQLLSQTQLAQQLTLIQENIPSTLRLPSRPDNLLRIYSLMTVESRINADQMIFRIKLPLFSHEEFELLHTIPVPFLMNNTLMTTNTTDKFLIINLHRDQYYPLSEYDLRGCMAYDEAYICRQQHPIYNKGANISACELSVLSHGPFETVCTATVIDKSPRWIPMLNPNKWIYIRPNPSTINVICSGNVEQRVIYGSGIITIQPNCAIRDEYTTIHGHNVFSSNLKGGFTPSRRLIDIIDFNTTVKPISYQPTQVRNITNDIEDLRAKIKNLNVNVMPSSHPTTHDVHQYTIAYICLTAIIITILYWWIKRVRANPAAIPEDQPQPPIPRPRTLFADRTANNPISRTISQPAFECFV